MFNMPFESLLSVMVLTLTRRVVSSLPAKQQHCRGRRDESLRADVERGKWLPGKVENDGDDTDGMRGLKPAGKAGR
jgi:hypothetical protein